VNIYYKNILTIQQPSGSRDASIRQTARISGDARIFYARF